MFAWRPTPVPNTKWHILRGDSVQVISGKGKGLQGKIMKVIRKKNQVLVEGVNLAYIKRPDDENIKRTKVIKKERPIHVSNVALIDPEYNKPTRIKYGYLEDGTKVRISKKSGSIIPKPDRSHLTYAERTKNFKMGPNDTPADLVL